MLVFSVYIPFLISRVRPVHSIFEKKSILENPSQIFTNLFFHAYMAYMPSFFAWLFRPAFKDNKVISSFSTFLRLLLSFFDIPRILPLFSAPLLSLFILFSEPLGVLRIASLVSASLFFLLSVFSLFIFFYSISSSLSHLSISISSISISSSSLVLYCVLFFSFSSLSHLTFPASFRYSSPLFSLFILFSEPLGALRIASFFSSFFLSCSLFFLSHLTFPAYLSLLSNYPLIDSEQCDNRFS